MSYEDIQQNNEIMTTEEQLGLLPEDPTLNTMKEVKRLAEEWQTGDPRYGDPERFKLFNSFIIHREGGITGTRKYHIAVLPMTSTSSFWAKSKSGNVSLENGIPIDWVEVMNVRATNAFKCQITVNELGQLTRVDTQSGIWGETEHSSSWSISSQYNTTLCYCSCKSINIPEFEGNYNFDFGLRRIIGEFQEALNFKEIKRPIVYKNCDYDKVSENDHSKQSTSFLYFKYKTPGAHNLWKSTTLGSGDEKIKEELKQAKEVAFTGRVYWGMSWKWISAVCIWIGDGNNRWRLVKEFGDNSRFGLDVTPATPGEGEGIWTNSEAVQLGVTGKNKYGDKYPLKGYEKTKYVQHPREIPGATQCNGEPWPPDGSIFPPGDPSVLPTGHQYYIKCTEGSLETCWTFDGFQSRDNHYNITAKNGRCLKYIKDAGCWHFFMSLPAAVEIGNKYRLKDIVTNNEDAYNYFNKSGNFEGKIKLNKKAIDLSPNYWLTSNNLYFASWTEELKQEDPRKHKWYLALFDFADGTTIRKPGETFTPIKGHFEKGRIYSLGPNWNTTKDWKFVGEYPDYEFTKLPIYNNFQSNHRVLYGWMERHSKVAGNTKFISPCTDPLPDGSLPPGVIGPPKPPKPKPPGDAGKDPIGPKPNQPGDSGSISEGDIRECPTDDFNTRVNQRLNGLYYYYLEENLFDSASNKDNTSILGTTNAIANVAYAPFLNINAGHLCKTAFDVKRFGEVEGKGVPWVFRIKSTKPVPMDIAKWNVYPKGRTPAGNPRTPWKSQYESRLLDYPYRKIAFFSNIFDMYDVIPHLHYQATGELTTTLKCCCPVTPGGNFYLYVDNYKGDTSGFIERQFTSTSMDIPNTSSAYSTYMATQKSQAANQIGIRPLLNTTGAIGGAALGAVVGSIVPGAGTAAGAAVGAAAGAVFSGGISMAGAVMDNMAKRADLMTTPKSLSSMGGDAIARLGDATKATVVSCDMEITDAYKDLLARYFHMYGTKQNRVLDVDSNINSRYYFNYIQTVGCSITSNGVPKRHVAKIKAIMDRGTTFWHLDREGVTFGEYCVYDNIETK